MILFFFSFLFFAVIFRYEGISQRRFRNGSSRESEGLIVNVGQVGLNLPLFINDYGRVQIVACVHPNVKYLVSWQR